MSARPNDQDIFETSSFSSLIEQEEKEEIIPLDLHTAALIGDFDTVRDCIRREDNLDHLNHGGWTPLMYAAYVGRDNILNLLLEAGAKIDIQSKLGLTALMLASYCASESIMYFLLQYGASINTRDHDGMTSLYHAVRQGHQSAVKLLASKGADLDLSQYQTGFTPIMEAAIAGHEIIFNILIDHGADVSRRTKKGENIRSLSMRYGNTAIVALLDKHTAPALPVREEALLRDKLGSSLSAAGMAEGNVRDGPAVIDTLMKNANLHTVTGVPIGSLIPQFTNKIALQSGHTPTPMSNSFTMGFPHDDQVMKGEKQQMGILKPPKDVFQHHHHQYQLPPKLPDTLHEVLTEYNLHDHLTKFESEGLNVATFLELSDSDLKEIGIDKFGPRKKILVAIRSCKERLEAHDSGARMSALEVEQYQVKIQDLAMQLQQALGYCKQLQSSLYQEQQCRQDFNNYFEAESRRRRQIIFYTNDIGKNCKEASTQVRKISDYVNSFNTLLQKLKDSPNFSSMTNELGIDSSVLQATKSAQCELEMAGNRLDLTFKTVERTLVLVQMELPLGNQHQQQSQQQQ